MAKPEKTDVATALDALFKAERDLRKVSSQLLHAPHADLIDRIARSIAESCATSRANAASKSAARVSSRRIFIAAPPPRGGRSPASLPRA